MVIKISKSHVYVGVTTHRRGKKRCFRTRRWPECRINIIQHAYPCTPSVQPLLCLPFQPSTLANVAHCYIRTSFSPQYFYNLTQQLFKYALHILKNSKNLDKSMNTECISKSTEFKKLYLYEFNPFSIRTVSFIASKAYRCFKYWHFLFL